MKNTIQKIAAALCAAMLCTAGAAFCPCRADLTAAAVESGTVSETIQWSLDDNGLLTISGTGDIPRLNDILPVEKVRSVIIKEGITGIGTRAFLECVFMNSVTIPETVTHIDESAFMLCKRLTEIALPKSVVSIGSDAFAGCQMLHFVTIPNDKCEIEGNAFREGVSAPAFYGTLCGHENIRSYAETYGRKFISLDNTPEPLPTEGICGEKLTWKLDQNGTLTISGTGSMQDYLPDQEPSPWQNRQDIRRLKVEEGVTTIGRYAFCGCTRLEKAELPESLLSIDGGAFSSCYNLTDIAFPSGLKSIGYWAFSKCAGLTEVVIPSGVETVDEGAFSQCMNMRTITFLNADCKILGFDNTISDDYNADLINSTYSGKVISAEGGEVQKFAENWQRPFEALSAGEIGDVNLDQEVNVLDVIVVNRYLSGSRELSDAAQTRADLDKDGTVTSSDSLRILKKAIE
ncbi:MAG: leucine-rich repeat protein [Oscillospiraceae bacterium]|nr:leucine-rich repeat protein [Oscillospiraceae bacterium]